jgi:putative tryptophan/tyrosine transport system substrate-binding protein
MRRREFIALLGSGVTGWPLAARAQQPAMPVVGFLAEGTPDSEPGALAAFREGLRETGYVEGHNVQIDYRWSGGAKADVVGGARSSMAKPVGKPLARLKIKKRASIARMKASCEEELKVTCISQNLI